MKHHIALKFVAMLLCAVCLFVCAVSALGVVAMATTGLYSKTVEEVKSEMARGDYWFMARSVLTEYMVSSRSNLSEEAKGVYLEEYRYHNIPDESFWYYTIDTYQGEQVAARYDPVKAADAVKVEMSLSVAYPTVLSQTVGRWQNQGIIDPSGVITDATVPEMTMPQRTDVTAESDLTEPTQATGEGNPEETVPMETVPQSLPVETQPPEVLTFYHVEDWDYISGELEYRYTLGFRESENYIVTLYLLPGSYQGEDHWAWDLADAVYQYRYHMIALLGVSLLLFAVVLVYLCCAAGRKPKSEEVAAGGLNRIPFDLYAGITGVAAVALVVGGWELVRWNFGYVEPMWLMALLVCAMVFVACLLVVALIFSFAAQVKTPGGFLWRRSIVGMTLVGLWKLGAFSIRKTAAGCKWLGSRGVPVLKKIFRLMKKLLFGLWDMAKKTVLSIFRFLGKMLRAVWRGIRRFALMLPLTWQWLLVTFLMIFLLLIGLSVRNVGVLMLCVGICLAIVMYGAHCFGILLEGTKRMSRGDLDTKVDDKLLLGSFQEYASHLNDLADVAVEAARKQMKSERMKAELITNVSHDIKTPLTSIINYVDLLQKAQTQEQAEEYLEVLNRQSQRLKKLIEDLMEMSKASTGNMAVELTQVDAAEAVNQALGEFGDKLEAAQLRPVFNVPQQSVRMNADGRLVWRVLSNLLSNAVKYALPGTRVYIDLTELEDKVLISLKNISREQLNVSSEELMERFVRGDESRNTEGSGLGLNIARSLMELQKGQLQLLVDGDLFKVTLLFPKA